MHTQKITRSRTPAMPVAMADRGLEERHLLQRWAASDSEFVDEELDWSDPLDAALGMELTGFRPGIDRYDA